MPVRSCQRKIVYTEARSGMPDGIRPIVGKRTITFTIPMMPRTMLILPNQRGVLRRRHWKPVTIAMMFPAGIAMN